MNEFEATTRVTALPGSQRTCVKETVTVAAAPARGGQPGACQVVTPATVAGVPPSGSFSACRS